jgi:hypothetical protein
MKHTYLLRNPGHITLLAGFIAILFFQDMVFGQTTENDPTFAVTFVVTSQGNPVEGANVFLSGYGTKQTNQDGTVVFQEVAPQTGISYNVTKSGYISSSGNVTVTDGPVNVFVSLTLITYRVTFHVTDADGPLEGALVDLQGFGVQTTGAAGTVQFLNIAPQENINYQVLKGGYHPKSGQVSVVNSNVAVEVEMVLITQSVSFSVTDGEDPMEGVTVTLGDMEPQTTGSDGMAVFEGILPGSFLQYAVTKEHFVTVTGHVTVLYEDKWLDIVMVPVVYFELEMGVEGQGTTTPPEGFHQIAQGTIVHLNAIPAEGWVFKRWVIDGNNVGGPTYQINMSGDRQAIAIFEEAPEEVYYNLTVNVVGEGQVDWTPEPGDSGYLSGTFITLTATPAEGHFLKKWMVNGSNVSPNLVITVRMNQDVTVEAHFDVTTQVRDPLLAQGFAAFPNPNNGRFQLKFHRHFENTRVRLLNTNGQTVFETGTETFFQGSTISLDAGGFGRGIYFLFIHEADAILVEKIMVGL